METSCSHVETDGVKRASGVVKDASRSAHGGAHSVRMVSRTARFGDRSAQGATQCAQAGAHSVNNGVDSA